MMASQMNLPVGFLLYILLKHFAAFKISIKAVTTYILPWAPQTLSVALY